MAVKVRETQQVKPGGYDYGGERSNPSPRHRGGHNDHSKRQHSGSGGWRDSNDYREDYFKRNHGIGGFCFICSQCFKPIFSKSKVQVDHIIPPSRFAIKRRKNGEVVSNSILARFLNNSFNCAAICGPCNLRKSNKMDHRIFKGFAMKFIEMGFTTAQFLVSVPFVATAFGFHLVHKIFNLRK